MEIDREVFLNQKCDCCLDSLLPKDSEGDFPGGPMVKNSPCNSEDAGSIPGWGTKIPCVKGQLSLCATTTEPEPFGACMPNVTK